MAQIAYCSNVHAGSDLAETRANLQRYACRVRQLYSPDQLMGVGLWLSQQSARQLMADDQQLEQFQRFLADSELSTFTFNGFPFGDFHQKVVKHDVYLPTWHDSARRSYTEDLIHLIDRFAPAKVEASISTLPIAWGNPALAEDQLLSAGRNLGQIARSLAELEAETGRLVTICIEPEPGCVIQYSQDIVDFFEKFLLQTSDESAVRRHIRVCHDVCHAVVMCESQRDVLQTYQQAGIEVGKVQVSSAVWVDFDAIDAADRKLALQQLAGFAEDRYLHQTTIQQADGSVEFFEDLPLALKKVEDPAQANGIWRIHFHVPVYLSEFGWLRASSDAIHECIECCREFSDVQHFEVETYAWNVLPEELQQQDLSQGIADELRWFTKLASNHLEPKQS